MRSYKLLSISLLVLLASTYAYAQEYGDLDEEQEAVELLEAEEAVEDVIAPGIDESELGFAPRSNYLDANTDYKERYTGDAYTYREKDEQPEKAETPEEIKEPSAPTMSGDFIGVILKILLGIVVVVGILFLVQALRDVKMGKVGTKKKEKEINRKVTTAERELETPQELDETNLQLMLKRALSEEDYYSGVRFYFLIYLEKLERNKEIVYHQDKTNVDYLTELSGSTSSDTFAKLSYLYEYVWYGKKEITAPLFEQLTDTFLQAIKK